MSKFSHPPDADATSRRDLLRLAAAAAAAGPLPEALAEATPAAAAEQNSLSNNQGRQIMSTISTADGTQIYYRDWGVGQSIVFSHGWPLTGDAFEDQMFFLASRGYRCVAHDRRGHGRSSQPWNGNDLDTYADDLAAPRRSARPEGCDPCRPFDGRWRGSSLHRPTRYQARRQSR